MIGVKNLSNETLVARYDGKDYEFVADDKVTTPLGDDAAKHIFGYGERDKTKALLRLGWLPNGAQLQAGLDRLGKFQFLQVEDIKFKESSDNIGTLPRAVSERAEETPLSAEEVAHAEKLAKPEGKAKQFAK